MWPFESNREADVAPRKDEFDTPPRVCHGRETPFPTAGLAAVGPASPITWRCLVAQSWRKRGWQQTQFYVRVYAHQTHILIIFWNDNCEEVSPNIKF